MKKAFYWAKDLFSIVANPTTICDKGCVSWELKLYLVSNYFIMVIHITVVYFHSY